MPLSVVCMCGCTCSEVSALCILINTESVQTEDQPMDKEEQTLAFQAEITARQDFLFQQEKLSEGGS